MPLKTVPIKPVEAHRLDQPRHPVDETPAERDLPSAGDASAPASSQSTPTRRRRAAGPKRRRSRSAEPRQRAQSRPAARADEAPLVNPYARSGRPHQVAVSLYVPQWERIEEQCAELHTKGVPDATVTRWLFALLHFRAPREHDAAADLMRWWARLEADEESAYFGLRNEARGAVLRGTVGGAARRRWRASTRARSSNSGELDKRHCRAQGTQDGGETSKLLDRSCG